MKIKKITLENFQCYYGSAEQNTFEFKNGLNLIIGNNNTGKSKLFDALFWVFDDKVFDTSERIFINTAQAKKNIVSDKAKYEAELGDEVKTEVEIEVETNSTTYYLSRSYKIKKKTNENNKEVWHEPNRSEQLLYKLDVVQRIPVTNYKDIERIKQLLMPPDIKPYLWYQGEDVNTLIDFRDTKSLNNAINALSNIERFDDYIDISEKIYKWADREYKKVHKDVVKDNKKREQLESEIEHLENRAEEIKGEKQTKNDELTKVEEKYNDLLFQIQDAKDLSNLNQKKESKKNELAKVKSKLDKEIQTFNNKIFANSWVLRNSKTWFNRFSDMFSTLEEKRSNELARIKSNENNKTNYRLPDNVPEPIYLKRMLEKEHCLVCDRAAPKGDVPYQKIKELLDKSKNIIENEQPSLSDKYYDAFKKLYNNGLSYTKVIDRIDDDIQEKNKTIQELDEEKKKLEQEITDIENQLTYKATSSQISQDDSDNIVIAFKQLETEKEKIKDRLNVLDHKYEEVLHDLDEKNKDFDGLAPENIDPRYIKQRNALEDFNKIAKSTKARVFHDLINKLEEEANKHFKEMTKNNPAVRGRIKLEKQPNGNYLPKNINEDGYELSSINDSNIILIKFAVIMSIISLRGRTSEIYTQISDAPTSKFDEMYKMGFYKLASEVFGQSIFMTLDFSSEHDPIERLTDNIKKLGNVYKISPNIAENERENRNQLETRIEKLK